MGLKFRVPEFFNVAKIFKQLHEENESFARKTVYANAIKDFEFKFSANHQIAARAGVDKALSMGITEEEMLEVKQRLSGAKYL